MKRAEPEPSKLRDKTAAYTSAYDERTRLFTALRDPYLDDDQRQTLLDQYNTAGAEFERQRQALVRK